MSLHRRQEYDFLSQENLVWGLILIVLVFVAASLYARYQHSEDLRIHGCNLVIEAPTGRRVFCGKGCTKPEHVYVYECYEGTRTEVY
jgi:hypothetical protein